MVESRCGACGHEWLSQKPRDRPRTVEELTAAFPRTCRLCGCTDADCSQCIARTGSPCHWAEADLCSACVLPRRRRSRKFVTAFVDAIVPPRASPDQKRILTDLLMLKPAEREAFMKIVGRL